MTEDGEVCLKQTPRQKERLLKTIDPENLQDELDALQKEFEKLEDAVDSFLSNRDELIKRTEDELKDLFDAKRADLQNADAAGDFGKLLEKLDQALEELISEKKSGAEKQETSAEAADAAKPDKSVVPEEQETSEDSEAPEKPADPSTVEAEEATEEPEAEEPEAEEPEEPEEPEKSEDTEEPDPETYYRELADKAEQLVKMTDWPYVTMELENIESRWNEGPDAEGVEIQAYRDRINNSKESFEVKKQAHFEKQKQIRQENLEKKKKLLAELNEIIEQKNWTATREVGRIRNKWGQIKPIPKGSEEELQKKYDRLISEFEDHKVDRLVKKKQKEEENLVGKLVILDKMDALVQKLPSDASGWKEVQKEMDKLHKQWHKVGRVPPEKKRETWERYHKIQDQFHQLRYSNDEKYKKQIDKFYSQKKQLIKEAEDLINDENLARAARKVNKLHRRWKKVGNLPQKEENNLWDEFKAATDAFNEKKSNNIDQLRDQEEENLEKKLNLIKQAEELKDSEEWDKTHDQYQNLMKQWKAIGPVPRKRSGKVWKQFKGAMDVFYERRRNYFKEVKEDRKENLEEKKNILFKLEELTKHSDPIQAVKEAKPLQEQFKKAGYVPFKKKNKMWKEYRKVCDVIYDRFRAAKSAASVVGEENVSEYSPDDIAEIQKKQKQASKLSKQIDKLGEEVLQMKESLSYFKPSGKGSTLLDEVHQKLENAEKQMDEKEEELAELEKEIDRLKREAGSND